MSRLIDKHSLIRKFRQNKNGERIPFVDCDNFPLTMSIRDVVEIIIDEPTVDDEPVVKSKWIALYEDFDGTLYQCNVCGSQEAECTKYCPECGAKMEDIE